MYCIFCGKQIPDNAAYCMYCGKKIHQEEMERMQEKPIADDAGPRVTAILLAAGRGTRMGSGIRKQFMELAGRPVLWSLNVLALSPIVTEIVLVIPAGGGANKSAEEEQEHIRRLFIDPLPEAAAAKVRALVPGGAERYNSVYNGLEAIQWPCDYVFIHDGARPLITEEMLEKLFRAVQEYKAVVAASPSKDTVKITDDSGFVQSTPDRSRVWNIQTPHPMLCIWACKELI